MVSAQSIIACLPPIGIPLFRFRPDTSRVSRRVSPPFGVTRRGIPPLVVSRGPVLDTVSDRARERARRACGPTRVGAREACTNGRSPRRQRPAGDGSPCALEALRRPWRQRPSKTRYGLRPLGRLWRSWGALALTRVHHAHQARTGYGSRTGTRQVSVPGKPASNQLSSGSPMASLKRDTQEAVKR